MKAKNDISNHDEELKAFAPTLLKIEKQDPFHVNDRYFDTLPAIIQGRCIENKGPSLSEWLQLILNPRVLAPVSAAIVLIIIGINFFISQPPSGSPRRDALLSLEQLSADDVYSSITAGNLNEFDEYLIVDALLEVKVEDEESNEEIINYLIENGIELSTIINQL